MAGVVGLEPTDGGVKVRCLTTWLHPNTKKPAYYIKDEKKSKLFCSFSVFDYATGELFLKNFPMMKLL